jgi:hypothetical protein
MIIAVHAVTGGLLGESIDNAYLAFVAGIILHYVLDAIPHFDNVLENGKWTWKQWLFTSSDLLITILFLFFLRPELSLASPFLWGAFGGILPDILDNVPFWRKKFRKTYIGGKIFFLHEKIHSKSKPNIFWGSVTQIATLVLVYLIIR